MKLNREICWLCISRHKLPKIVISENRCHEQTWDEFYNEFVAEWGFGILDCAGMREYIIVREGIIPDAKPLSQKCPYFLEQVMSSEGTKK